MAVGMIDTHGAGKDKAPASRQQVHRALVMPLFTAVIVAICLTATFLAGQRRGMDHAAAWGPEDEQDAIAIAISDLVYHLDLGYVGYGDVLGTLRAVWDGGSNDTHSDTARSNSQNGAVLDRAITAAASLGPQQPGFIADGSLITMIYQDVGYVDFVKLSFRLFGLRFAAMYNTFFVVLAFSSLLFLISFWRSPIAQAVLIATILAFFIELYVGNFVAEQPSFVGMRNCSTLGAVPLWHFVFLLRERRRFSLRDLLPALIQVLILALAISIRGSARWTIVFLVSCAVVLAFLAWRKARTARPWRQLLLLCAQWPLVVALGGVFLYGQYVSASLHPVYSTDDVLPYHGLWHSVFFGLAAEPELLSPALRKIQTEAGPDQIGYEAAAEYLNEIHFMEGDVAHLSVAPTYFSPWTHALKFRLHDRIMRDVVMRMVREHPLIVAEHYAKQPLVVSDAIVSIFDRAPSRFWLCLVGLGGLVAFIPLALLGVAPRPVDAGGGLLLVAAAIPFAALPNLLTFVGPYIMGDTLLTVLVAGQLALAVALAIVAYPLISLVSAEGNRFPPARRLVDVS